MNDFEYLYYMSYMNMRKHHKEEILVKGRNLGWKYKFSIDDNWGEIYQM
jgi:hypothetical protein